MISTGSDTDFDPDVAYEPNIDRWLVVFERAFSTRDHDIIARRYNADGGFIDEVAVATGTRESYRPSVAANAGARQFLVVWDEDTGIADRVIKGRTRTASTTAQGATFVILDSSGVAVEDRNPAVGGTISSDAEGDRYIVASELWTGNTPGPLQLTRVSSAGTVVARAVAGAVTDQATDPVMTKARPTNGQWLLAYRSSGDVHGEALDGVNSRGINQIVENQGTSIGAPAVTGDGFQFYVAYSRLVGSGDSDIRVAHLRLVRGVLSVLGNIDATQAEGGAVITVQNPPALGARLRARATTIQPPSQIWFVGVPSTPLQLCPAGCKLGMSQILLTVPGADLNLTIACDMNLIGARIALQNVLVGGPTGCTTANFPVAFTVSDTVIVQVQ